MWPEQWAWTFSLQTIWPSFIPEDLKITFDKAQAQNEEFAERSKATPSPVGSSRSESGWKALCVKPASMRQAWSLPTTAGGACPSVPRWARRRTGCSIRHGPPESVGLIKFDFLGLKTLDQIRDAIILIERNTGEKIDIGQIPFDDKAVYEMLGEGDTQGVFQVGSPGMRNSSNGSSQPDWMMSSH